MIFVVDKQPQMKTYYSFKEINLKYINGMFLDKTLNELYSSQNILSHISAEEKQKLINSLCNENPYLRLLTHEELLILNSFNSITDSSQKAYQMMMLDSPEKRDQSPQVNIDNHIQSTCNPFERLEQFQETVNRYSTQQQIENVQKRQLEHTDTENVYKRIKIN